MCKVRLCQPSSCMWLTGVRWLCRSLKRATRIVTAYFILALIWNLKQWGCVCVWFRGANLALCDRVCVVSPHRQRASSWRPGVWRHSRTCRCGARTDAGMRCNLWRVQFDYRTGTVTPLLSMSVGITWHDSPALTRLCTLIIHVVNITLTVSW